MDDVETFVDVMGFTAEKELQALSQCSPTDLLENRRKNKDLITEGIFNQAAGGGAAV